MKSESKWYFTAIPVFLISFLLINSSVLSVIDAKLRDGSVTELGRYHFTFDAYQHISEDDDPSIIAWGSSKMREAFNGNEFEEYSIHQDANFYNLAFAAERPYYRLPEISSMINAEPDVLMLELGPSTFSTLQTPLDINSLEKMNSILFHRPITDNDDFIEILEPEDRELLELGVVGKFSSSSRYGFPALENSLVDHLGEELTGWDCDKKLSNVRCVPNPESPLFDSYLRQPPQFSNYIDRAKTANDGTLEEFYGERLDKYIRSSYHNPEGKLNKNQLAFDYIIDQALNADIEVILVALPYNPVFMNHLETTQWDYYYSAIENFSQREDLTTIDLSRSDHFSNDQYFNDYSHMASLGEEQFTRIMLPHLDEVLNQQLGNSTKAASYPIPHELPPMIFQQKDSSNLSIELSKPASNEQGKGVLENHSWVLSSTNNQSVFQVEPDSGLAASSIEDSPHLRYCFFSTTTNDRYLWVRSESPSFNSDSIWLGKNGVLIPTGDRGIGLKSSTEGKMWYSKGDNGERVVFPVTEGQNCIDIWMREDGVVVNELLLANDIHWVPEV
jgi:hypothetical protein